MNKAAHVSDVATQMFNHLINLLWRDAKGRKEGRDILGLVFYRRKAP
jgi:hypothetical protein